MDDFVREYKEEVLDEFFDHLSRLEVILGEVKSHEDFLTQYREIFRIIHSMKGGASSADFNSLTENLHIFETILLEFDGGSLKFNKGAHDFFVRAIDFLFSGVGEIKSDLGSSFSFNKLSEIVENLKVSAQEQPQMSLKKIIIIDDNPEVLETLKLMVEESIEASIECHLFSPEALKRVESEAFDVIITDYEMPNLKGSELIEKVRKGSGINRSTPMILVTGYRPIYNPDQKTWKEVYFVDKTSELMRLGFILKCCLTPKKAA